MTNPPDKRPCGSVHGELGGNAHRLLRLFEQIRERKPSGALRRLAELNLSFSHIRALHMLAPDRVLAMKDMAEALHLTPPSVTALTRRLLQTGLVQRQTHEEDSRVALISLTDEGRSLLSALYHDQLERMARLLAGLAPAEQEQLISLLEQAVQTLQEKG
jgi:DNA-binding MarR family transcriptional regulator